MLTVKDIRKRYGTERVLEKVSFSVGEGQKIALVGLNGSGKSTLLKIIAKLEIPDRGTILMPNRLLVGYLPQEALAESDVTLMRYLRQMAGLETLEKEMTVLESRLNLPEVLEKYEMLRAEYTRLGGYDFIRVSHRILEGLMLQDIASDRLVSELSGGEKRKVALAGVLLRGVDLLLLDEPTNNLDLPALVWLEQYLKRSRATVIIASHDRRFLDNVAHKVLEIDWYRRDVTMYTGGWSTFAEMKARSIRRHKEQYRAQEDERERLLLSVSQKMHWVERVKEKPSPDHDTFSSNFKKERATKKFTMSAKALEERQKRLKKVERPMERDPLSITFDVSLKKSEQGGIVLEKLCFGYPSGFRGGPVNLTIPFGSRVALLGNNGVGKSTLLKTIAGELPPLSGKRIRGEQLTFGYLMQEYENVSRATTPIKLFQERLNTFDRESIVHHLVQFQFSPMTVDDKIASFSPGERVRLILALLSALSANVLILDEPTNHLDLESIEALEEALETYTGTIILVTHDRRFLERLRLTERYILEDGKLIADHIDSHVSVR